jgi:S1-C subfamily serine protease
MDQIVEHGHVRRGRIGVSIKDMTPPTLATYAPGEGRLAEVSFSVKS